MIVSFRHKGLEELYQKGKTRRIDVRFWPKLKLIFAALDILDEEDLILSQSHWMPHKLSGKNPKGQSIDGHWSLKVSGNWRLTYRFNDGNVELIDFMDYH